MRSNRKPAEQAALELFAEALQARGIPPYHEPNVMDKPDALFILDGRRVAVECRYLAHPRLLHLLDPREWPANHLQEIFLPIEPHLWVRDAIANKTHKVDEYVARTEADKALLLLHSSSRHLILEEDCAPGTEFFELLRLGGHLQEHAFDSVWLAEVSTSNPHAVEIYRRGDVKPSIEPPSPPRVNQQWFGSLTVRAIDHDGNGERRARFEFNYNDVVGPPLCLPSLDPNISIDYDAVLAKFGRNDSLSGLHARIFWKDPRI